MYCVFILIKNEGTIGVACVVLQKRHLRKVKITKMSFGPPCVAIHKCHWCMYNKSTNE